MEMDISGFPGEYATYSSLEDNFHASIGRNTHGFAAQKLQEIEDEFANLDVKMRLAFGITEIHLGPLFVDKKYGPLKECHLLYYKLADLWFAYETFIKFLQKIQGAKPHKVDWIGQTTYARFSGKPLVAPTLAVANVALDLEFGSAESKVDLLGYLQYCLQSAESSGQQRQLQAIIQAVTTGNSLSTVQMLALIYAIRCNFVHNGETTVVPRNFTFEKKLRLLRIVYPFLAINLLTWVNQAMTEV